MVLSLKGRDGKRLSGANPADGASHIVRVITGVALLLPRSALLLSRSALLLSRPALLLRDRTPRAPLTPPGVSSFLAAAGLEVLGLRQLGSSWDELPLHVLTQQRIHTERVRLSVCE